MIYGKCDVKTTEVGAGNAELSKCLLYSSSLPIITFWIQQVKILKGPLGQVLVSARQNQFCAPSGMRPVFISIAKLEEFSRIFLTIP